MRPEKMATDGLISENEVARVWNCGQRTKESAPIGEGGPMFQIDATHTAAKDRSPQRESRRLATVVGPSGRLRR